MSAAKWQNIAGSKKFFRLRCFWARFFQKNVGKTRQNLVKETKLSKNTKISRKWPKISQYGKNETAKEYQISHKMAVISSKVAKLY
jgi:hypothetical protein